MSCSPRRCRRPGLTGRQCGGVSRDGGASLAIGFPATAHLSHYVAEVPANGAARHLLQVAQHNTADAHPIAVTPQELLTAFGFPPAAPAGAAGKDGS